MSRNLTKRGIFDVIVIGGGASGMMAAFRAAERGKRVLIIEKNDELGKKLAITGGGRCNIMHDEFDIRALLANFGDAQKYLFSAFAQFGPKDTYAFFSTHGLSLVTEDRKRIFPKSGRATDVNRLFGRLLSKYDVHILTDAPVLEIMHAKGLITGVRTKAQVYTARSYVLATGGLSHPETGSTGDGFEWLKALGHTVAPPSPDVVPLIAKDTWVITSRGKTLDDAHITFTQGAKRLKKTGKMMFTHFGLSGPVILNSAGEVKKLLEHGQVTFSLDLFPKTDEGNLRKEITTYLELHKNKTVRNALHTYVPYGLSDAVCLLLGESSVTKKVHSFTKEERNNLAFLLKHLTAIVVGTKGYDWAVVSDGGIQLSEVNMATMASKKYTNLFLTGDMLNISRPSGGFSLQLCWTTGYVAGSHV